jgi:hypothetical protein
MPHQNFLPPAAISSSRPLAAVASSTQSRPAPHYIYSWSSVVLAACVAALAITLYMMLVPRMLGIEDMDIGITIGGMVDPTGGLTAFLVRVSWHVGNGLIYVLAYAAILCRRQRQSNAWKGVIFGVFLWLAGPMLLIPMLLNLHSSALGSSLSHPGIFMLGMGLSWTPATVDLVAHLIHGTLVGVIYKHRIGLRMDAEQSASTQPAGLPAEPPTKERAA